MDSGDFQSPLSYQLFTMKKLLFLLLMSPLSILAQCHENTEGEFTNGEFDTVCASETPLQYKAALWPNPTRGFISITGLEVTDTEGVIFDAAGRFVRRVSVATEIDVQDLADGFYLIRTKKNIFKFIKSSY